jgi:hypothetical protein
MSASATSDMSIYFAHHAMYGHMSKLLRVLRVFYSQVERDKVQADVYSYALFNQCPQ